VYVGLQVTQDQYVVCLKRMFTSAASKPSESPGAGVTAESGAERDLPVSSFALPSNQIPPPGVACASGDNGPGAGLSVVGDAAGRVTSWPSAATIVTGASGVHICAPDVLRLAVVKPLLHMLR